MDNGNMNKIVGVLIALIVLGGGLFFIANSGDDEEADTTTNNETSQQVEDEPEEPAAAASNIVELAIATDDLSTLVTAVTSADLAETLSGAGPFTVFAPTNAAFDALPDGTLAGLLEPESKDDLTGILTYHVVPSAAFSTDLSDGMMLETVNGEMLEVSIADGVVKINGATVTTADIEASNGVVHVIDSVLLP